MQSPQKPKLRGLWITGAVLLVLVLGTLLYCADYYHADATALSAQSLGQEKGVFTFFDGQGDTGIIFYPGGKVEAAAYAPLLYSLSKQGIPCVLVKMPLNLAVFAPNAYKRAEESYPKVTHWYIAGHSLGGAMASGGTKDGAIEGLILLAAYPTQAIDKPVLSLLGDRDGVLNQAKYQKGKALCPYLTEKILVGGNHAGFGSYGEQRGDGVAALDREQQWSLSAEAILQWMNQQSLQTLQP